MLIEALFIQPNYKTRDKIGYASFYELVRQQNQELMWEVNNSYYFGEEKIREIQETASLVFIIQCPNIRIKRRKFEEENLYGTYTYQCHCEECDDEVYLTIHGHERKRGLECYSSVTSTVKQTRIKKLWSGLRTVFKSAISAFIKSSRLSPDSARFAERRHPSFCGKNDA